MKGLSNNVTNHEFQRFHDSVGQKIADPGSISTQKMFPLISVTPKPLESPYGAKYLFWQTIHFFSFFPNTRGFWLNGLRRKSVLKNDPHKTKNFRGIEKRQKLFFSAICFCPLWRFRPFWRDRMEGINILRRNRTRVSKFLSHRIGFLENP